MSEQWFVKVYDNYHYMDESATSTRGPFASADAALAAARDIVENSLYECLAADNNAQDLIKRYRMFGDDPTVLGPDAPAFSAWDYVDEIAPLVIAGKMAPLQQQAPAAPSRAARAMGRIGAWFTGLRSRG